MATAAKTADLEEKAKQAKKVISESKDKGELPWKLIHGDCLTELATLTERPRLIFADPPYNIGVDYGDGAKKDQLPENEFVQWLEQWIVRLRKSSPTMEHSGFSSRTSSQRNAELS